MTARLPFRSVFAGCLCLNLWVLGACKPTSTTTPAEPAASTAAGESAPAKLVQAADPPELAQARQLYLTGSYAKVVETLEPNLAQWQGDTRQRTRSLAQAWIGLAQAESVPENAQSYVEGADELARTLDDYETRQLANVARAAYLMGISDHDTACKTLQRSLELSEVHVTLAKLMLGNCLLNQAFSGDQVTDPSKLQDAQKVFDEVKGSTDVALRGRAFEGLAALAKYRSNKAELCAHAKAALADYQSIAATPNLLEGPQALLADANCT